MDTIEKLGTILASFVIYHFFSHILISWFSVKVFPWLNHLSLKKKIDWNMWVVAVCHSLVAGILWLYILLFENGFRADGIRGDSSLMTVTIAIIAGYLTSDLLLYIFYWRVIGDIVFVIQCCIGLYTCYLIPFQMEGVLAYFVNVHLLRSLATPFLSQLYFLDILEYSKLSEVYIISGVFTVVMYFLARIIATPYFYYFIYCMYGIDDYMRLGLFNQLSWISCFIVISITDVIRITKIIMMLGECGSITL